MIKHLFNVSEIIHFISAASNLININIALAVVLVFFNSLWCRQISVLPRTRAAPSKIITCFLFSAHNHPSDWHVHPFISLHVWLVSVIDVYSSFPRWFILRIISLRPVVSSRCRCWFCFLDSKILMEKIKMTCFLTSISRSLVAFWSTII